MRKRIKNEIQDLSQVVEVRERLGRGDQNNGHGNHQV